KVLGLRETTLDDDSKGIHDWRTYSMPGDSLNIPGRLVEPLNPEVGPSTVKPFYLFQTPFLIAQASLLIQRMATADLKVLPKLKWTLEFPYHEQWGKAVFLAQTEVQGEELTEVDASSCSLCVPAVPIDPSPPRILEHMGADILLDSKVDRSTEPCGMCGLPAQQCRYVVVKERGSKASNHVDWKRTVGCARPVNFSCKRALEYSDSSPCTNVPLVCPLCTTDDPAVWRYNLRNHLEQKHSTEAVIRYASLWTLSEDEVAGMKRIWRDRRRSKATYTKKAPVLLTVSDAHRSIAPLHRYARSPFPVFR
ncbi:hypothetical protein DFP72DRAFT_806227, partial [Ephemerocybe angulata]